MTACELYHRPDTGCRSTRRQAGFTLLELLVTLTILSLLAAIVAPQVLKYIELSRLQTAQLQVDNIAAALDLFHVDMTRFPTEQEGLQALLAAPDDAPNWHGPYLKKAKGLIDPWGVPYHYASPGQHGDVDVFSYGNPKTDHSADEPPKIANW
jgi:general secretion pathway protein G